MSAPARGRRLEPDVRREEILAGAMRLFGAKPYAAVSTVDLAREAGVARGLINHYFGTKRELYLEVVRRLTTLPAGDVVLPAGSLADRAGAAVDWFLDAVERHRGLWLAVGTGAAGDPDVDAILSAADEIAADRVVADLVGPGAGDGTDAADPVDPEEADRRRARVRSFFGLVRSASREWLVRGTLDRARTSELLVTVLCAVLDPPATRSSQV